MGQPAGHFSQRGQAIFRFQLGAKPSQLGQIINENRSAYQHLEVIANH